MKAHNRSFTVQYFESAIYILILQCGDHMVKNKKQWVLLYVGVKRHKAKKSGMKINMSIRSF